MKRPKYGYFDAVLFMLAFLDGVFGTVQMLPYPGTVNGLSMMAMSVALVAIIAVNRLRKDIKDGTRL